MNRHVAVFAGLVLIGVSAVSPSYAWWRGGYGWHGGGWRGGWGGPAVGLYVGSPYYYGDPYYPYVDYVPYYDDGIAVDPEVYNSEPGYMTTSAPPETGASSSAWNTARGSRDLKGVERAISALESDVKRDYADGDISRDQRDDRLNTLHQIRNEAKQEAAANGGKLSPQQADAYFDRLNGRTSQPQESSPAASSTPSTAARPSTSSVASSSALAQINDLLLELHALLDQKVKDGSITKTQGQGEQHVLDTIEEQVRRAANSNGGNLSSDDAQQFTNRLNRAYYLINHDFVSD